MRKDNYTMGMSASQARLLSITSRLTNNEFRAQTITNSKLRLATESEEASQRYMDALSSQQLMFMTYDDNGSAIKTALTPMLLSTYEPLKNQYVLRNNSGKVLVSGEDAKNFEKTNDLLSFLNCYDLVYDVVSGWQEERDKAYQQYLEEHKAWELEYAAWKENQGTGSLYSKFINSVGNSLNTDNTGAHYCYYYALNSASGTNCYLHLLNHILGYEDGVIKKSTYNTSLAGTTCTTNGSSGGMDNNLAEDVKQNFIDISSTINDETILCDGADRFTPYYNNGGQNDKLEGNIIQEAISSGNIPTDLEILMSDYKYDASTNTCTGIKSVKQKAIDLYYIIQNYSNELSQEQRNNLLINFTEGDLKQISQVPIEPTWIEPARPDILLKDREKSQWYINLWYAMNGSNSANEINKADFDSEDSPYSKVPEDIKSEYFYTVSNNGKNELTANYCEYETNLYTSSSWLQFALEHGLVSIEQAQYYNPSEDSDKVPEMTGKGIFWQSIIYTNARDIISQDDEVAIAIAEAKYKKEVTEIEHKDKKYDQDLKKLDTEHSALQTEYEAIKEVITKNTERSFKAFS